jgi:hypothetical protein
MSNIKLNKNIKLKENRTIKSYEKKNSGNFKIEFLPGNISINPITLEKKEINKSEYITNYFLTDTNSIETVKTSNDDNIPIYFDKKFMLTPPVLLPISEILKCYDINNIDDMIAYVKNNIKLINYETINRVLNCWIRHNFEELKKNNEALCNIYYNIYNVIDFEIVSLISKKKFSIEVKKFVNIWFKKNNPDSHILNLLKDIDNYLDFLINSRDKI